MEKTINGGNLKKGRRPKGVWVISIFYLFSVCYTILSFYLIETARIPLDEAQDAYFQGLTTLDYGLAIVGGLVSLIAAVALFLLRKIALYLFLFNLVIAPIATLWHIMTKGLLETIGGSGFIGMLTGWIILTVVCLYCWKLVRRGVLT